LGVFVDANHDGFASIVLSYQYTSVIGWHIAKPFDRLKCESEVKIVKEQGMGDTLLGSQHFGGRRACWNFGMGLGRMTNT
jgi:hypothetical protein